MTHWYLPGLLGLALFSAAQASHLKASLDDIVLLSQRGVSDKTLLLFLEDREAAFTLDAESIDKLILAGVSEDVIRYLLAREPIVHTSRPAVIYPVSTYVETYPRYYYTPRYYRTPYYAGYSDYPYDWFGYGYGGYRAHGGHRATHFGGRHDKHNRRDKHSTRDKHGKQHDRFSGGQHDVTGDHRGVDHGNQPHTGKDSRHHRKDDQSHGGMASRRSHRGGEQAHTGTSGSHNNRRGGHTSSVFASRGSHSSKGHSRGHGGGGGH